MTKKKNKEKDINIKQKKHTTESKEHKKKKINSQQQTAELEQNIQAAEDKYLRLYAEFDNFRKRAQSEKEDFAKYAATDVIKSLLPLMDSFERAKKSFEKHTEGVEDIQKGLALIHRQFEDILEKIGVKKITAKGEQFNPKYHEAVMQQETKDVEPETVVDEMQPGFMLYGKVIRPAMVVVAK